MNARLSHALLPLAAIALCASLASAQQAPTPPAPPADNSGSSTQAPPAPIERHAPPPGMRGRSGPPQGGRSMHGRPGMDGMAEGGPMEGRGMGQHGMWWKDAAVVQQLSLTPDQVKRMDSIFEQSRLQLIDLRATLQKQEVMLEPLLGANPVDTAKAMTQIDRVADARAELEKADAKMLLRIRAILTPDQWTKLNDRQGRRGRGGFRGPGGPDGPPPAGMGRPRGPGGPAPEL